MRDTSFAWMKFKKYQVRNPRRHVRGLRDGSGLPPANPDSSRQSGPVLSAGPAVARLHSLSLLPTLDGRP